jgi:hypothetical protein
MGLQFNALDTTSLKKSDPAYLRGRFNDISEIS